MRLTRERGTTHVTRAYILIAFGALAGIARPGAAQSPTSALQLGLFGGASSPLGDFADVAQLGFHLGARFGVRLPNRPVGVHAEAQWHRFTRKRAVIVGASERAPEIVPLTLNLDFGGRGRGGTYLTVGAGAYHSRVSAFVPDPADGPPSIERRSATRLGFNAGMGSLFDLGGRQGFVELRLHRVSGSDDDRQEAMAFVPFSFGVRF